MWMDEGDKTEGDKIDVRLYLARLSLGRPWEQPQLGVRATR